MTILVSLLFQLTRSSIFNREYVSVVEPTKKYILPRIHPLHENEDCELDVRSGFQKAKQIVKKYVDAGDFQKNIVFPRFRKNKDGICVLTYTELVITGNILYQKPYESSYVFEGEFLIDVLIIRAVLFCLLEYPRKFSSITSYSLPFYRSYQKYFSSWEDWKDVLVGQILGFSEFDVILDDSSKTRVNLANIIDLRVLFGVSTLEYFRISMDLFNDDQSSPTGGVNQLDSFKDHFSEIVDPGKHSEFLSSFDYLWIASFELIDYVDLLAFSDFHNLFKWEMVRACGPKRQNYNEEMMRTDRFDKGESFEKFKALTGKKSFRIPLDHLADFLRINENSLSNQDIVSKFQIYLGMMDDMNYEFKAIYELLFPEFLTENQLGFEWLVDLFYCFRFKHNSFEIVVMFVPV